MIKNEVLYSLHQQKGNVVTGSQLASSMSVSRNAVWKAIRALQADGVEIVSVPHKGYRLANSDDTLIDAVIHDALTTKFIGREMRVLTTTHSTNQYLKELDEDSVASGLVVIADEQTNGRGRLGRSFISAKGEGVYFSILLNHSDVQQGVRLLTICAAAAVSKAIEKVCGIRADIKWVNDIFCKGKKVCGILTEAVISAELQMVDRVIVGIGINTGSIPTEIRDTATSIREAAGVCGIRNRLIAEVLNQFEEAYLNYTAHGRVQEIIDYYSSRLFIIGERILVSDINCEYFAVVLGVDNAGTLIVNDDSGNIRHLSSGEIKLKW